MTDAGPAVAGTCDERFTAVKTCFEQNLADGSDLGGAVSVVHGDEMVVDLWGGFADVARTRPWERDTLVPVTSTSKVVATIAGLMLLDRRLVALDEPIATYWPEFGAAGKESIPVRQIFSHATGVAGFDPPTSSDVIVGDWEASVSQLASQEPWWEPGTRTGYHSRTYGYLIGELVRRTTGRSYADFVRDELTVPLDAEFTIGVPDHARVRVAEVEMVGNRELPDGHDSIAARAEYPAASSVAGSVPAPPRLEGCNPSGLGVSTARAIASIGALIANSGTRIGERFLSEETVSLAWTEQSYEHDLVMGAPVRWGMGFGLASEEVPLPFPRSVHWGGLGGSIFCADPDSRTSWCYTPNRFLPDRAGDDRGVALTVAVVASILQLD